MRLAITAALAGALLLSGAPAGAQWTEESHVREALDLQPGETLLEVEALGVSSAVPDLLTLDVAVVTTGLTAQEAIDANTVRMNAVLEAIGQAGIDAADIQTNSFRVEPEFEDNDRSSRTGPPLILGYTARNAIDLRIRSFDRAPQLMDGILAAGANDITNPSFTLADDAAAVAEARGNAVELARAQAETYAAAFNMRIARVIRVSERGRLDGGSGPITVTGTRVSHGIQLIPGEIETEVQLWVDYALVPQ